MPSPSKSVAIGIDAPPAPPVTDHTVLNCMGRTPGALLTEYKIIVPLFPAQKIDPAPFTLARTTFGVPALWCPLIAKIFNTVPFLPSNIYNSLELFPSATISGIPSPSRSPAKGVLHVEIALFVLEVHAVRILKSKGGRVPAQSAVLGTKLF
jgi:hypothetical protein